MAELIAIASADWHFHDWKQFNEDYRRTLITENFILELCVVAEEHKVPIWIPGDWFHTPKGLTTRTLFMFNRLMAGIRLNYPDTRFITTSGNHDTDEDISLVQAMQLAFPDIIQCIDNDKITMPGYTIYGIPYQKRNKNLVNKINFIANKPGKKVLLIHTELYGAPDPSGHTPEPMNLPRDLKSLFKGFKLVLAGHVHKYIKVRKGVYMVGAPNQQRKSDAECEFGYLKIYDDFSVEFVKYNSPGFRYYKEGEWHVDTNDFWIEIPKPRKLKKHSEAEFKPTMDKTKLAKKYMKEIKNKSPRKLNVLIDILNLTDD